MSQLSWVVCGPSEKPDRIIGVVSWFSALGIQCWRWVDWLIGGLNGKVPILRGVSRDPRDPSHDFTRVNPLNPPIIVFPVDHGSLPF